MARKATQPATPPWSPQRRHWVIASIVVPLLCVCVTAVVALVAVHRDDHPPAAPVEVTAVPPPDQSNPCGPLDDDKITAGWGPDRPTVVGQQFTATAQMDSDRDTPNIGDERSFLAVKDATITTSGHWESDLNVEAGKTYLISFYVHNSADGSPDHAAHGVRVRANVPNCTAHKIRIDGFISADDTFPTTVFDSVVVHSDRPFNLTYKPGSARYYNNPHPQGTPLTDDVVTSKGALVGVDQLDGVVPGNYGPTGYAIFEVTAAFTD